MKELKRNFRSVWNNTDVKRWAIEGLVSIAVGVLSGCLAFNALNNEKKSLSVSTEGAAAPIVEDSDTDSTDVDGTGLSADDPDADVVIEVVEGTEESEDTTNTDYGYAAEIADWSNEEIEAAINERSGYASKSKYSSAISSYWENVRGVTDVSNYCMYLFDTSDTVYASSDFEGLSAEVIHIAKNEIYARHGYSFNDSDLFNYFMAQIWYTPTVLPADFSEDVFTETEVKNLDLLNELDTYQ